MFMVMVWPRTDWIASSHCFPNESQLGDEVVPTEQHSAVMIPGRGCGCGCGCACACACARARGCKSLVKLLSFMVRKRYDQVRPL